MADDRGLPGRSLTAVALIAGALSLTGGLIFLCAAAQNIARLPIALALLAIGAGLAA